MRGFFDFRPRYDRKVGFAGNVFEDKEFGRHYDEKKGKNLSETEMKKIAEEIKKSL